MTREDVCGYIRENYESLQARVVMEVVMRLVAMEPEEICQRFKRAGKAYGEFVVDSIDTDLEIQQEVMDLVSYLAIREAQER